MLASSRRLRPAGNEADQDYLSPEGLVALGAVLGLDIALATCMVEWRMLRVAGIAASSQSRVPAGAIHSAG